MHPTPAGAAASPWGPARARLVLTGLVAWLGGVDYMLLHVFDDGRFLLGWVISAAGLGTAVVTLLSGLLRGRVTRWSFPGTVLDVPRTAGVRARTAFVVLALLGAGPSILMAALLVRLGSV